MAVVLTGGADALDGILYSQVNPGTLAFINNNNSNFSAMLNQSAAQFFQTTAAFYDRFDQSAAIRAARAAMRMVDNFWQTPGVHEYREIGQFQHAHPDMQRWIMAEPMTRQLYHEQRCDGYSDTYVDREPGLVGERQYDYRRVMNGVFHTRGEDFVAVTYHEDLLEGDRDLTLLEQADILDTWRSLRSFMKANREDPTSKYNASL